MARYYLMAALGGVGLRSFGLSFEGTFSQRAGPLA